MNIILKLKKVNDMNVTITAANGGYIVSTQKGLFVTTSLNTAMRIAKEQFSVSPEGSAE